ncbi:hypothetical protein ABT052_17905 [Streptomyces sp. NPDC002766]|uniref:hypothetical protein n=1 Tax=Streptomyces sp. NPDC002766 TaxID=3154429 RepID=UPI00332A683A
MTATIVKPTVDHLMDAPLDDLLAEFGVEEVETRTIPDPEFTGYMTVGKSGQLLLATPPSRPQAEREIVVRALLGTAFGVELPDLPDPYRVSVFDKGGEPHQVNPKLHGNGDSDPDMDEALRRVREGGAV